MQSLRWPSLILVLIAFITAGLQYVTPTLPSLTNNLCQLLQYRISPEFFPLILAFTVLVVPVFISALIMRTFCRYIHESRRSLRKTHLVSSFFYVFSICTNALLFTMLMYTMMSFSKSPGNILFFMTKRHTTVQDAVFNVNVLFTIVLFMNAALYIVSTYVVESMEMRRINKINDFSALILDSSYISTNFIIALVALVMYVALILVYTVLFYTLLSSFRVFVQPMVYCILFAVLSHVLFVVGYTTHTNVSLEKALIANDEK
ncbi:putative transporter [Trachipleistophora hominis]|uniref:Putative transporter n=1 Tax=Trachipleistophora hominis TaxID=72359 RepID=L7JWH4_TRAHO|nr:putative transporter [Trachipleistophora hominis]